jgi:Amt family ammonium transporter
MAERTQLKGFAPFAFAICSFIYPVVCYWGWSGSGLLNYTDDDGKAVSAFGPAYKDFAGSGIVHLVGGMGALCGTVCVGARKGRWEKPADEALEEFGGHSVPFCVLGTFCLWFGWYGFNPGSTLSMKTAGDANIAGLVAVNTTLAPCIAGLLVFFLRAQVVQPKFLDVAGFCNGILAGLVSITAGCAFVKPWEAIIIGAIGAFVYQGASMTLKRLKVDDVVDAFPVHGACGIWGVLALGFFGDEDEGMGGNGVFYGGDQLWTQVMGVVCIIGWTAITSLVVLLPLRQLGMLRWSDDFQEQGADFLEHSPESGRRRSQKSQIKDVQKTEKSEPQAVVPNGREVAKKVEDAARTDNLEQEV